MEHLSIHCWCRLASRRVRPKLDLVFWIQHSSNTCIREEKKKKNTRPAPDEEPNMETHRCMELVKNFSQKAYSCQKDTRNNCVGKGPVLSFPLLEAWNDAYFKNTGILLCWTPTMLMMWPDYKKNPLEELERALPFKIHADHQRCSWVAHQQEESSYIIQYNWVTAYSF